MNGVTLNKIQQSTINNQHQLSCNCPPSAEAPSNHDRPLQQITIICGSNKLPSYAAPTKYCRPCHLRTTIDRGFYQIMFVAAPWICRRPRLQQITIVRSSNKVPSAVSSTNYHRSWLLCNNVGPSSMDMSSAEAPTNYHLPRLQQSTVGRAIYELPSIVTSMQ